MGAAVGATSPVVEVASAMGVGAVCVMEMLVSTTGATPSKGAVSVVKAASLMGTEFSKPAAAETAHGTANIFIFFFGRGKKSTRQK